MPSPIISTELRQAWKKLSISNIIDILSKKGLNVELKNYDSKHLKIKGKVRAVDFYASTGTVSANPVESAKLSYCSYKEMMPERAFERILSLANIGH